MTRIARELEALRWTEQGGTKVPEGISNEQDAWDRRADWPMREELRNLLVRDDVGLHIKGVVANINCLVDDVFTFLGSGDRFFDSRVEGQLREAINFCLRVQDRNNQQAVLRSSNDVMFAQAFLRVAALYHDIGKIIGNDRHVSRGVHLMRDVNDIDREAFEQDLMGGGFEDKHNFWTLLSHHDIFGCLCTGEAALPALSEMVSWAGDSVSSEAQKNPAAVVSYLLMLNVADADSSLRPRLSALRTVEGKRYLEDWRAVVDLLWDEQQHRCREVAREAFKEALLRNAGQPRGTIERITRIVTTSYRMNMKDDLLLDESEVKTFVEDELAMLHGSRLQMFCYLFARFCKIDYGRRFFDVVMRRELLDERHQLLVRQDRHPAYEYPERVAPVQGLLDEERTRLRSSCLKDMTRRVCNILKRIVDDYGDSVAGDPRSAPLMCIVMANLMPNENKKTAWAICRALKDEESRALAWISEEVAVSPYSG